MSLLSVLVIEDDALLAEGIVEALKLSNLSVDHFVNGKEGFDALIARDYSAVVLDLNLPVMEGLEIVKAARARGLSVPILILTAQDSIDSRVLGLNLGADDYLTKPFSLSELEARVKALLRRRSSEIRQEIVLGKLVFDIFGRRASIDGSVVPLTARETDLLEILLANQGHPVNKDDIVDMLFGFDKEVGINAIEVCMHRLRKKCADAGVRFDTVRGIGYLIEEEK